MDNSRKGEAIHEVSGEWELSIEGDSGARNLDICELLDDRSVLLVDVDEGDLVSPVVAGGVGLAVGSPLGTRGDDVGVAQGV